MRFEAKVLRALTFSKEFVLDDKDGEKPVNDLFHVKTILYKSKLTF